MQIRIRGAHAHNLKLLDLDLGGGLTVITGISGSGKTSLAFDTIYHEARSRYMEVFSFASPALRPPPAEADEISGLPPAVAVGQDVLNRNPASTLASACGLHPLFRILYTRFGERTCERCRQAVHMLSEDEAVALLQSGDFKFPLSIYATLAHAAIGSHRTLLRLLEQQFGVEALRIDGTAGIPAGMEADRAHRIEVLAAAFDQPPAGAEARQAFQHGAALGAAAYSIYTDGHLMQRFALGSICAGCGTWVEPLETSHFNRSCPHCAGQGCQRCANSGLHPLAAAVRWRGLRLPELLGLTVGQVRALFSLPHAAGPTRRIFHEISSRLDALEAVGLGYLCLDRSSPTLSRGEAQRVRLAVALNNRLEDVLHVLDEPTIGLHPADVKRLLPALRSLGGAVIYVEHDRLAAAQADRVIDLGPGAGDEGGHIVFDGTPSDLWQADTPTGRCFSLRQRLQPPDLRPPPQRFLHIRGANLRTLKDIDVSIPLARLTVVTGVSGSGKSTLVEDVFCASLQASQPVGCRAVEGLPLKAVMVTQDPIGRNPRSNPATYTKLSDILRDIFAAASGLSASHFSFNRPEGACEECGGMGAVEVRMAYLPSSWVTCPSCGGERFEPLVLHQRIALDGASYSIAGFYELPVARARHLIQEAGCLPRKLRRDALQILAALEDVGLGYIRLGQPSPTLSGGEAQRVKLAKFLARKSLQSQVLVLDEPSTGLHPQDIGRLLLVFDRLVRAGATVIVVEHNSDVIRAADWVIDLGAGAGEEGGEVLYSGALEGLRRTENSLTGRAMNEEESILPASRREEKSATFSGGDALQNEFIRIRGARAHNLKSIDVDIPKGKITVISGVSGSGKSSLVHDVLEAEARRRFLASLSMYERQSTHEGAEAEVDSISGLGVALSIGSERRMYERRATVGVASEISHHLAVLLAGMGQRSCLRCGAWMEREGEWTCPACGDSAPIASPRHFMPNNYAAACLECNGVGTRQVPVPEKLIIHPEKPLCGGAMYSPGFFPQGYLCKPGNGGYYLLRALAERFRFDPDSTPWQEISPEAQHAFLFGDNQPMQVQAESHSGRKRSYQAPFPGFYGFIRDWDIGGTYTRSEPCPACQGGRLRAEYAAVSLGGLNLQQLSHLPLCELAHLMDELSFKADISQPCAASLRKMRKRLGFMLKTGLGYLHLDRVAATLSAGEAQRVRLAGLLGSGLTSLTLLLDEPTRGLHAAEVDALTDALKILRDEGNTLVVIEHDSRVLRAADLLVDIGPGSGAAGGRVVACGSLDSLQHAGESVTAAWLNGQRAFEKPPLRRRAQSWMRLIGAKANNLAGDTLELPLGVLAGVCGVSGSGKSTLILDTLGRILAPRRQTTSVAYEPLDAGEYERIEGAAPQALVVDQSRSGVHSPASFLGIDRMLRNKYAESEEALALGIGAEQLKRACTACGGSGLLRIDMGFLPDVQEPCELCRGSGYHPEAWQVRLRGLCLPELDSLSLQQVLDIWQDDERLLRPLKAACEVGLGYLALRQPGYSLSGGEAQRLKMAGELCKPAGNGALYILDEPTVGQHLEDVLRLAGVLQRLACEGGGVVVVEHHPHLLACCDWLVELGPGGGAQGGRLVAAGTPEDLAAGNTPVAPYLRQALAEMK